MRCLHPCLILSLGSLLLLLLLLLTEGWQPCCCALASSSCGFAAVVGSHPATAAAHCSGPCSSSVAGYQRAPCVHVLGCGRAPQGVLHARVLVRNPHVRPLFHPAPSLKHQVKTTLDACVPSCAAARTRLLHLLRCRCRIKGQGFGCWLWSWDWHWTRLALCAHTPPTTCAHALTRLQAPGTAAEFFTSMNRILRYAALGPVKSLCHHRCALAWAPCRAHSTSLPCRSCRIYRFAACGKPAALCGCVPVLGRELTELTDSV